MLDIELRGSDRVARHIRAAMAATGDLRPVWNQLEGRINDVWKRQFETEGSLTGGWPPLDPQYRARKSERAGQRESIMQRSGQLMRGMVNPFNQSDGAVRRMSKDSYERGTSLPYASAHEFGRGVPRREILVWRRRDNDWLVDRVAEHVTDAFE